ncbi:MAG: carboxypeptidase regulatory-like domain-containing protein, partial [Acidobacteria bacterium]
YVGSYSENLLNDGHGNINLVPEGATLGISGTDFNNFRPFQNYGAITERIHSFSQNYNSLQVLLARQTGRLTYSVAYTFGKNLGYRGGAQGPGGNEFDTRHRDYGVISYDRTHVLNIAYSWLVPDLFKGSAFGKALINGWQFSGISIFQSGVNLGSNQGYFGIQGTAADGTPIGQAQITGSDAVTIQPVLLCDPRSNLGENQYINGSCFGAPSPGKNGMFPSASLLGL